MAAVGCVDLPWKQGTLQTCPWQCCCRQVQPGKPWFEGCLTGVGDCAHATRPDLGQGGAMAIEVGTLQIAEMIRMQLGDFERVYSLADLI